MSQRRNAPRNWRPRKGQQATPSKQGWKPSELVDPAIQEVGPQKPKATVSSEKIRRTVSVPGNSPARAGAEQGASGTASPTNSSSSTPSSTTPSDRRAPPGFRRPVRTTSYVRKSDFIASQSAAEAERKRFGKRPGKFQYSIQDLMQYSDKFQGPALCLLGCATPAANAMTFEELREVRCDRAIVHAAIRRVPGATPSPRGSKSGGNPFRRQLTPLEETTKRVRGILNKITPERFPSLSNKLLKIITERAIDSETLESIVGLIFERATKEVKFVSMYAELCNSIYRYLPVRDGEAQAGSNFRKVLLQYCQEYFSTGTAVELHLPERYETLPGDEQGEIRANTKERIVGSMHFLGELYHHSLVGERVIHKVVTSLLKMGSEDDAPSSMDVECACGLLWRCGKEFDGTGMDIYFAHLRAHAKHMENRLKFVVKDLIELRKRKWIPRRSEDQPMALERIRDQYIEERHSLSDPERSSFMSSHHEDESETDSWASEVSSPRDRGPAQPPGRGRGKLRRTFSPQDIRCSTGSSSPTVSAMSNSANGTSAVQPLGLGGGRSGAFSPPPQASGNSRERRQLSERDRSYSESSHFPPRRWRDRPTNWSPARGSSSPDRFGSPGPIRRSGRPSGRNSHNGKWLPLPSPLRRTASDASTISTTSSRSVASTGSAATSSTMNTSTTGTVNGSRSSAHPPTFRKQRSPVRWVVKSAANSSATSSPAPSEASEPQNGLSPLRLTEDASETPSTASKMSVMSDEQKRDAGVECLKEYLKGLDTGGALFELEKLDYTQQDKENFVIDCLNMCFLELNKPVQQLQVMKLFTRLVQRSYMSKSELEHGLIEWLATYTDVERKCPFLAHWLSRCVVELLDEDVLDSKFMHPKSFRAIRRESSRQKFLKALGQALDKVESVRR